MIDIPGLTGTPGTSLCTIEDTSMKNEIAARNAAKKADKIGAERADKKMGDVGELT